MKKSNANQILFVLILACLALPNFTLIAQSCDYNGISNKALVCTKNLQVCERAETRTQYVDRFSQNPGYYNGNAFEPLTFKGLSFGWDGSGEGIASKRHGDYTNKYGIDFYTLSFNRMNITNGGDVLMGYKHPNPTEDARVDIFNDARGISLKVQHNAPCFGPLRKIGIQNTMVGVADCSPEVTGIENVIDASCGVEEKTGMKNFVTPTSNSTAQNIGIENIVFNAPEVDRAPKTGIYNEVQSREENTDPVFGIYNNMNFPHSATRWGITSLLDNQYGGGDRIGMFTSAHGVDGTALYARSWGLAPSGSPGWAAWIEGQGFISSGVWQTSDRKLKKDIKEIEGSLDKILQLQPHTYHYKADEYYKLGLTDRKQFGFIAQELEEIFPELVMDIERNLTGPDEIEIIDGKENKEMINFKAVQYTPLIPVLVDAIKEQQEIITIQAEQTEELRIELAELKAAVKSICNNGCGELRSSNIDNNGNTPAYWDEVKLEQNTPNPFNEVTSIRYFLPEEVSQASLLIYDLQGKQIKNIAINETGTGSIDIHAGTLSGGMYLYGLLVDGKASTTLKMILTD